MNLRLLVGRLSDAWLEYPAARRRIAAVPPGRPIFLTGTHRSGTTWVAKMLAASGIWYVHEPFSPKKGRRSRSFEYRALACTDAEINSLFADVLAGNFRSALGLPNADHPLMPLRLLRPGFNRVLVKDPLACLLTEYLTRQFNLQTVILFRHPAGFVSSINRLGWPRGLFLRRFLADEALMETHLEPFRDLMERYKDEDSIASAAVLHGVLTSVLYRFAQTGVGAAVSFEDLCRDPIIQLQTLFKQLELPYDDRVREIHNRACFGSVVPIDAYHRHSVNRNSMAMADSWKQQLRPRETAQVREIWEKFGIALYRADHEWTQSSESAGALVAP